MVTKRKAPTRKAVKRKRSPTVTKKKSKPRKTPQRPKRQDGPGQPPHTEGPERNGHLIPRETLEKVIYSANGIVSQIAKKLKVTRTTIYIWRDRYDWFAKMMIDADNASVDTSETELHKMIRSKKQTKVKATCTIFHLKTKGKDRGYIERTEIDNVTDPLKHLKDEELIKRLKLVDDRLARLRKKKADASRISSKSTTGC